MKLDENYRIENDSNNFILKFERPTGKINNKSGKEEVSKDEWYFPKMSQALIKYCNESMKESKTVDELLSKIDALELKISSL